MKEKDEMLKIIFQDKPIALEPLKRMNTSIMNQILAVPVDFQEKLLVKQRRKWGVIFISLLFALSLSIFLIGWFFGPTINAGVSAAAVWLVANIPFFSWFQGRWDWLFEAYTLISNLKLGYQFLWGHYGLAIVGILISWVFFEGLRDKRSLHQKEF